MMRNAIFTTPLIALLLPAAALAQEVRPFAGPGPSAPELAAPRAELDALQTELVPPATVAADITATLDGRTDQSARVDEAGPGRFRQILHAVGGAAVGAWVGYMASQVWVGSWDERGIHRGGWAASGAALGVTLGLTIPTGPTGRRFPIRAARSDRQTNRNVVTREQIQKAQAGDLYTILRSLRPEWFRTRGTGSMRETPRGEASGTEQWDITIQPGIATVRVYLEDTYMGGLATLHDIDPALVGQARFLDTAEATQRWGSNHIHGAIAITLAPAN